MATGSVRNTISSPYGITGNFFQQSNKPKSVAELTREIAWPKLTGVSALSGVMSGLQPLRSLDNTANDVLQDEIRERHDAYAELEKENDDLIEENERLVRKNKRLEREKKRYKKTISRSRSVIESMLNRPLQADDHNYPYLTTSIDQILFSVRKSLET